MDIQQIALMQKHQKRIHANIKIFLLIEFIKLKGNKLEKIKYNKDDLVRKLSQKLLFSNEDMKFMVDNFLETILEILKQPKDHIRIELRNFGIFEVKPTKAKPKARNPRTNEEIFVPAHRKIMFKPGKNLKTELKKEWKI